MTTLPGGLTVQQIIAGLGEVATLGLDALEQPELAALVPIVTKLAEDAAQIVLDGPSATEVLTSEVDAEQSAGDAAELAKVGPKP